MTRRDLFKATMLAPFAATRADVPPHLWQGHSFGSGPAVRERLNQGPFDIESDAGWRTLLFTTASEKPLRNPGLGLVGYTWEEGGPALGVRAGRQQLAEAIEAIASLPFVDVLYLRCDWRNVQKRAGRLDLDPVWSLTLDAAKRHGLRVAFRVQLSNPEYQPKEIALPSFLRDTIPLQEIGALRGTRYVEPRYDHPSFQAAFAELNQLLAAEFDPNPLIEWVDLMQYGFWGEGHSSSLPSPFPDTATAERTFAHLTQLQLDAWKRTPLAVNTQPDISHVGNRAVIDMAVRAGAWLRSDSIVVEEPEQIEELANRPPWCAAILEDGYFRHYDAAKLAMDDARVNVLENYMLHTLDVKANYWSLWTEAENLKRYNERFPRAFERLRQRLGYRIRPSWIWQRKRDGRPELVVAISNTGVAAVPGVLWLNLTTPDGKLKVRGALDAGHPFGNAVREGAFLLPREFAGPVQLSADLEVRPDVFRSVRWACEQPVEPNGSIRIDVKRFDDPGWRKGV